MIESTTDTSILMRQSPKSPLVRRPPIIECLEQRIAPAALTFITPQTASYVDADGSHAYVTVSKGTLSAANFVLVPSGLGYQLETLDLSKTDFKSEFENASVNIYAHPSPTGGDGTVDVGWINATGIDLEGVRVHGDLGRISAGDTDLHTPAIATINVLSMGLLGVSTQAPGGNLVSNISGGVREWTIFGNFEGATIQVADNNSLTPPSNDLNEHLSYVAHMDIRGSVIGGETAGSGEIIAAGGFKSLHIGGDIIGGAGANTGEILTERSILNLTVGGSLAGGAGDYSGAIVSPLIRHTSIGGGILGGAGDDSGTIQGVGNNLITYGGEIMVHGSVTGGAGNFSGYIQELNPVQTIIGGDVIGGGGDDSGEITANRAVDFRIGGSLEGGGGAFSGVIDVDKVFNSVHVLRDMTGGGGEYSGSIVSFGERIGHVIVTGSMQGGSPDPSNLAETAAYSGSIICEDGGILSVTVGGSVIGGGGSNSANIKATGSVGTVSILGNFTAGSGPSSTQVWAGKSIAAVSIFGDIDGAATGVGFFGTDILEALTVGGDIKVPVFMDFPVTAFKVRGSIDADDIGDDGAIIGTVINRLQVNGGILGVADNPVDILLAGKANATGDALPLLKVFGSVTDANILAGYAPANPVIAGSYTPFQVVNAAARIGSVVVDGDWAASNLVAGVSAGPDGLFGTADDFTTNTSSIVSEIASVVILGEAVGDTNPADHFGFVAQEVASVEVANYSFVLTPGPGNDTSVTSPALNVGPTGNLTIHEVA